MGYSAITYAHRNVKHFSDIVPICPIFNDIRTYIRDIQRYPLSYRHKNMHRKRVYSVQIYNNCAILFQITYTLYIKPYVFCTGVYLTTWNGVYFTVSPLFLAYFWRLRKGAGS